MTRLGAVAHPTDALSFTVLKSKEILASVDPRTSFAFKFQGGRCKL